MKRHLLLLATTLMVSAAYPATLDGGTAFGMEQEQPAPVTRENKKDPETGFEWTEVRNGDFVGVEINGKTIVPCRYGWINYFQGYFIPGLFLSYEDLISRDACYTTTGKCLIHENRGYERIYTGRVEDHGFIEVEINQKVGVCDLNGKELISPKKGYEYIFHDKQNKNLYGILKDKLYGVYDVKLQREIIPPKYDYLTICQAGNRQFIEVKKGDLYGVCLENGKEIVPPQYDYLSIRQEDDPYIEVRKDGLYGIYLNSGKELFPPKYKSAGFSSGQFYYSDADGIHYTGLDITGNPIPETSTVAATAPASTTTSSTASNTASATASTTTSTPSSTTTTSTQSSTTASTQSTTTDSTFGKLLFDGTFTATGQGIAEGQISVVGEPTLSSFKIYEKRLYYHNNAGSMPYCGDETLYNVRWRKYADGSNIAYFVSSDGMMLQGLTLVVNTLMGPISSTTYTIYEYGDTRARHAGNSSAGNNYAPQQNNNYGGSYNTPSSQKTCSYCHGSGTCPNCHGTGWVSNPFAFEHTTGQYPCVNCNKNGDRVNNPNKGRCSLCNGTGRR